MRRARREITSSRKGPFNAATYLADLGFQREGLQHKNKQIHSVFMNIEVPPRVRRNVLLELEDRLTRVPNRKVVHPIKKRPPLLWQRPRIPSQGPLTVQLIAFPPNQTVEEEMQFLTQCEVGVWNHINVLVSPQQTQNTRAPIQCLINNYNFSPERYVPQLYFSGFDRNQRVYVKVMAYAAGESPTQTKTKPRGLAEIERALFTLWLYGISLRNIDRHHLLVAPNFRVHILDLRTAEEPVKKTKNVIASSRNPLFHYLWDPPKWFVALWNKYPIEVMKKARGEVWKLSGCDVPNNNRRDLFSG